MALRLPKDAPLYFEATNFTRFTNTVFRALGGLSGEYCDAGKRALIMWRAITELAPHLNITSRGEVNSGIVDQSLRAVAEMESLGINPEALVSSLPMVKGDKRLASKLSDLAKIYSLFKTLISEKYSDSNDAVNFTVARLGDNPDFLRGQDIFIEGFTSFTEAQYALIGRLAARCNVTVYLPVPKGDKEGFEHKEILRAEGRLKTAAKREGADVSLKKEDGRFNTSSELLSQLPYEIWKINSKNDNLTLQNAEELRIIEANTPFDECDYIASDIRRRVMEGARYSDFAIIARSADKYKGILDGALSSATVPYFLSTATDLSSLEPIKLIYTAFSIIQNGFRREDVITYAKCGLSGISRDECDELEIYADVWQIGGKRFTDGIDWNMNPDGYSNRKLDKITEKLDRINRVRYKLISPLMTLSEDMDECKTVRHGAEALMRFLLDIRLEHRLREREQYLRQRGDTQSADEIGGLWKIIIGSLDTMVEVTGELPCTIDSFLSQLKALFSCANLGRIPAFVDQVTIGSADMLRLSGKRHVYLLGVNAGEFPAAPSEGSYFSESDRIVLAKAGLDIEPELEVKNARELFCFSRALASASESVTLLYSQTDTKFKRISRAEAIDKIIRLTGVRVARLSDMSISERLYSASGTANALDTVSPEEYPEVRQALINSGWGNVVAISEGEIKNHSLELDSDLAKSIYGENIALTQTKLDSFARCPMGYFLRYTLKLNEFKKAEFDASNIGTFIHGCLENFFTALTKNGISPESLDRAQREKLTSEAAEKYLSTMGEDMKTTGTVVKLKRLIKAAVPIVDELCDELTKTSFGPRFFELKIDSQDDLSPSPIKLTDSTGGKVYIYGTIDRVDTYQDGDNVYVRVLDYKTGSKEFSVDDMKKGRNLQMFLYLKSILESDKQKFKDALGVNKGGKIIPAGVIYIKTALGDVSIDRNSDEMALEAVKNSQVREGMMLEGDYMENLFGEDYIPGKKKRGKGDEFKYSEEGFGDIMGDVEASVIRIAEQMRSGKAEANPDLDGKNSPCDWCEYKPVCRNVRIKK